MYPWLSSTYAQLQARIGKQQLHHGLLFVADHGVGEHVLINKLTKALLCSEKNACGQCKSCMLFDAQSHPDMKYIISDKPSIGVDLIRQVSEFVTTTSQMLGNKVVIIEHIENMTESASNSLLKTLEEPSHNTYLLLSTNKPNSLLATITSRCEKVRLQLPNVTDSLAWLSSQTETAMSEEGLIAFLGSPIDYLASLSHETSVYGEFCRDIDQLLNAKLSELAFAEKTKSTAEQTLAWIYQKAVLMYKQNMLNETTQSMTAGSSFKSSHVPIEHLIADCQQANKKIGQAGINKSLILQQILYKFKSIAFHAKSNN